MMNNLQSIMTNCMTATEMWKRFTTSAIKMSVLSLLLRYEIVLLMGKEYKHIAHIPKVS